MPRFAANLSTMFQEHPFLDRFAAAADAGFQGVEFLFPYDWPAAAIAAKLEAAGLEQVLFNLPPGDWSAGQRGLAGLPGREAAFAAAADQALEFAAALGCRRLHAMAGIMPVGARTGACRDSYVRNLAAFGKRCAAAGITALIEPINSRDMPGYLLSTTAQARTIIGLTGSDSVKLQLDLYHTQIMEGDLTARIRDLLPMIGHIQIAGVPDRHEPDHGEVNYPWLFGLLDELGYDGWIGCEYRPRAGTTEGLGWFAPYRG